MRVRRSPHDAGFTLLESLVALTIFAMVSALMAPSFVTHLRHNYQSSVRSGAMEATQQTLEGLRATNPESLPSSGALSPSTVTIGNRAYQVDVSLCTRPAFCTARSRHLLMQASLRGDVVYEVETVYTRLH